MPIYEYSCRTCNRSFEELVRGDERIKCPYCESHLATRKMSVCGIVTSSRSANSEGRHAKGHSGCGGCSKSSCAGC